jgi:hypothetical protein
VSTIEHAPKSGRVTLRSGRGDLGPYYGPCSCESGGEDHRAVDAGIELLASRLDAETVTMPSTSRPARETGRPTYPKAYMDVGVLYVPGKEALDKAVVGCKRYLLSVLSLLINTQPLSVY